MKQIHFLLLRKETKAEQAITLFKGEIRILKPEVATEKLIQSLEASLKQLYAKKHLALSFDDKKVLSLTTHDSQDLKIIQEKCQSLMEEACMIKYPKEWSNIEDHLSQKTDLTVVTMDYKSVEYQEIANLFRLTMPTAVIKGIQRIQNSRLWKIFNHQADYVIKKMNEEQDISQKNLQLDDVTRLLFHGTSQTDPKMIYESEEGFDMRFSNEGMWGRANYFAVKSAYSNNYCYKMALLLNSLIFSSSRVHLCLVLQVKLKICLFQRSIIII